MSVKQEIFVREFILGIGFLSGLWIAAGVDPEAEIMKAFAQVLADLGSNLGWIFYLLPIISLLVSLLVAFNTRGKLGLVGIGLAFLGGVFLLTFPIFGILLTLAGIICGNIVVD